MSLTAEFETSYPFAFDPFQIQGCETLEAGRSVLVCAPTGAGKTVVGEFAVWLGLKTGRKTFYTTPLKALSNQKFGDFIATHGASNVGLLTGDNSINGDAPVVVMTTEVLRNMLYEKSPTLRGLGFVVMDEVHYLKDRYRGAVWEEVLIHLSEDVRIAALSATVSNAEEFGDWIATVRGDTDVVIEDRRPVPLQHRYLFHDRLQETFVVRDGVDSPNPALVRATAPRGRADDRRQRRPRFEGPRRPEVVDILREAGLLPAICFIFSRAGCDQAVRQCVSAGLDLMTRDESERVAEYAEMRAGVLDDADLHVLGYAEWVEGLKRGIAGHHAGLIPLFKETVEELFERGLLKVVFATETLSLGINMPARTVVIERLMKFTGERHEMLTPSDYTQLTGRAGRRGTDTVGYGVVIHQPDIPFDKIAALAGARTYPLSSSFRPSYNMAVNLIRSYSVEDAQRLLNLSFGQFLADRGVVKLERKIEENERFLDGYSQHLVCDRGDVMEWWDLMKGARDARRDRTRDVRSQRMNDVALTLGRLEPGQVLRFDRGRHRGLAVVLRRVNDGVFAVGERGDTVRVNAKSWRHPPRVVGTIKLPEGHRRTPAYLKSVRERLNEFTPADPGKPAREENGVSNLERQAEEHPVAGCPDRAEHQRWAERTDKLHEENGSMRARIERRTGTLARTFTSVLKILERFGYAQDGSATERGERLCRIYNESDLLVAEALETRVFDDLDPPELAAVVSTLVYETRAIENEFAWPTERVRKAHVALHRTYRRIRDVERERDVEFVREPDPGFVEQIYWWAKDEPLDSVLAMGELSTGDFVRSTKNVRDLLKQLSEVAPDDASKARFRSAADALFRGVVAYAGSL